MAPLPMAAPALLPPESTSLLQNNFKQKPSRPLLRRATATGTIRTADEAELDFNSSGIASTPLSPNSKRARTVTFSPIVEKQVFSQSKAMEGFTPDGRVRDLEATRVEVRIAIEEHVRGSSDEAYDGLKEVFGPVKKVSMMDGEDGPSNDRIKTCLLALTSCVSLLGKTMGKDCSGLVKAVLESEWMGRDEGFVKIYVHFLGNLVSAQGAYVGTILSMLIGKFTGREYQSV